MPAEAIRETMQSYAETLLERGDYRRLFADGIRLEVVGTDQRAQGGERSRAGDPLSPSGRV